MNRRGYYGARAKFRRCVCPACELRQSYTDAERTRRALIHGTIVLFATAGAFLGCLVSGLL
jgi:hypothetical protein